MHIYIYIYTYTYIYIYIYRRLGGVRPTGKSFRFVRACVRAYARCPMPSENAAPAWVCRLSLFPFRRASLSLFPFRDGGLSLFPWVNKWESMKNKMSTKWTQRENEARTVRTERDEWESNQNRLRTKREQSENKVGRAYKHMKTKWEQSENRAKAKRDQS